MLLKLIILLLPYVGVSLAATYQNPIIPYNSPDPFVTQQGFYYYLTFTEWDRITVRRSRELTNWANAETRTVFTLPAGRFNLWSPEIHFLRGNWYIYFTMDDGVHANHRMYVIRALDPNNPLGQYSEPVRLAAYGEDYFAIDGTVYEAANGNLYLIWSGWTRVDADPGPGSNYHQNLYIAPMSDPMTVSGGRVLLREAGNTWEFDSYWGHIVTGPQILKYFGRTFLTFSASSTWTADFCVGALVIDDWQDPLVAQNWRLVQDGCLFYKNDGQGVFGPGHASFTTSPDGRESWMVYHAISDLNDPGNTRLARAERFYWSYDYTPVFPRPVGFGVTLETPSGQ